MERMLQIKGYNNYLIDIFGNVFSLKSLKLLRKQIKSNGYIFVGLYKKGKMNCKHVHRLVAETFILNPDNKPQVNHKDGNKQNNYKDNLEWVTQSENMIHAVKHGLHGHGDSKGERNGNCKLDKNDIFCILILDIYYNQTFLSKMFNIKQNYISKILNFKNWKTIGDE